MNIPSKIKALREARGFTIPELGKKSGVSVSYIRQVERGVRENPTADVLSKLAVALGTTV